MRVTLLGHTSPAVHPSRRLQAAGRMSPPPHRSTGIRLVPDSCDTRTWSRYRRTTPASPRRRRPASQSLHLYVQPLGAPPVKLAGSTRVTLPSSGAQSTNQTSQAKPAHPTTMTILVPDCGYSDAEGHDVLRVRLYKDPPAVSRLLQPPHLSKTKTLPSLLQCLKAISMSMPPGWSHRQSVLPSLSSISI